MARTTKDESLRMHQAIVQATVEEIADHGYHGLRVPAVARRVGKTQGVVYGRFADKEALTLAALRAIRDELLMPTLGEVMARTGPSSPLRTIEGLSAATAEVAQKHPSGQRMLTRLAVECAGDDDAVAREVRDIFQGFVDMIAALVVDAQQRGEVRKELDALPFAHAVIGMQIGLASIAPLLNGGAMSYESMEEIIRPVLTRGIRS